MTDVTTNRKLPVQLADRIIVEAVHYDSGTLCISSQAGCAVGCPFCASGQHGLRRNLTLAEFDLQVATAEASGLTPQRITISGIGEPLHNWANVVSFMERCRRRQLPVSITTTGAPLPRLAELLTADHNGVMLSLHAADAATHRQLVPGGPDFSALRTLLGTILPSLPRRRRRKVGINYLLLAGLNDQPADLARLIAWLRPWPELTLHLLAWNEVENRAFATDPARIDEWHAALTGAGINTRRPNRWRGQTVGGCGTLFIKDLNENGDCP